MPRWLRKKVFNVAARVLTKPRGNYNRILPTDLETLRLTIRKGDVVLVDGDQRVSEVIKYLTQSSWSHVALYVGDELLRRFPTRREELVRLHGQDAQHLIIEALNEGVVASSPAPSRTSASRSCPPRRRPRRRGRAGACVTISGGRATRTRPSSAASVRRSSRRATSTCRPTSRSSS